MFTSHFIFLWFSLSVSELFVLVGGFLFLKCDYFHAKTLKITVLRIEMSLKQHYTLELMV